MKNKKIKILVLIIIGLVLIKETYGYIKNANSIYKFKRESEMMFSDFDERIKKENKFYKDITSIKEYNIESSKEPYIPEEFIYIEGEWNTGFVIQDQNENQYVWVPCTNKESDEIVKLNKYNFCDNSFIDKNECVDEEYEEFLISTIQNGGFYISRFEIGKEDNHPVSKKEKEIFDGLNRTEAMSIIDEMYSNNNIKCSLINGYAYDTALYWIKQTNNIEVFNFENKELIYTGRNSYNNIFDLTDNVFELTLETSYDTVIIRGMINEYEFMDFVTTTEEDSRFSILQDENFFTDQNVLGFRTILYK